MDFTLVTADDWQGLYIDNKLVAENHSLSPRCILQEVSGVVNDVTFKSIEADSEWLAEIGSLPEYLKKVKVKD